MKKRLWQLHSWCGLVAGLGLLVIGLSGSILVFHAEVDALLDPGSNHIAPPRGAPRLSFDTLFAKTRAHLPEQEIAAWQVARDPLQPDEVAIQPRNETAGNWRWIKVNPYTGQVLADAKSATRRKFTDWLLDLHVSMLAGDWGTILNGGFAALLCGLGISGVWLYRDFWRNFFRLRWRASARIFRSDLHKMIGISSVIFNLILGFTGAWWSLPTLSSKLSFTAPVETPTPVASARFYNPGLSVDALVAEAQRALPGLQTGRAYLNFPPRWDDISVQGQIPTKNPFRNDYGGEVTFDKETGALKKVTDIRRATLWTQIEDMMTPLHFGTFGGMPIKVLWCLGGLTPSILAISGFLIWRARRPRRVNQKMHTLR